MEKRNNKDIITLAINIILFIMPFAAWMYMTFNAGKYDSMSLRGIRNLQYYTVESNLLYGISCLIYFFHRRKALKDGTKFPRWVMILKLTAVTSVTLTFMCVMGFLGPVWGYASMVRGANFFLHLVVPVSAIVVFLVLETEHALGFGSTLISLIPTTIYAVIYLGRIIIQGRYEDEYGGNDWYGFAMWGLPVSIMIFFAILVFTFAFSMILRIVHNRRAHGSGE